MSHLDLHVVITKSPKAIDEQRWSEFMKSQLYHSFAVPLLEQLMSATYPLLVEPIFSRPAHSIIADYEAVEFILPVRAVRLEDYNPVKWLPPYQWTFWRRLKFLFTGKFPGGDEGL